jgi:hypothetical protein
VEASMGEVVTETMLYATVGSSIFEAGVTVHKMVKISEVASGDGAFARQLKRKFV